MTACEQGIAPTDPHIFWLRQSINVNIDMPTTGTHCLIFTEYPYNEGMGIGATPVIEGLSPIKEKISIPKATKKLYMIANGKLTEFEKGDINYTGAPLATASTRAGAEAATITDALYTYIYNLYPDNMMNITQEERDVCSDLRIVDQTTATNVKLTWVAGVNGITNDIYWYVYEKTGGIYPSTPPTGDQLHHLCTDPGSMDNPTGLPEIATGTVFDLGDFYYGDYIGFAIKPSNKSTYRYSTPVFNEPFNNGRGADTQGVIRQINFDGKNYCIIGMEDNYGRALFGGTDGEEPWSDGDFNDMLAILTSNPVAVPETDIDPPTLTPGKVITSGMWLFEDNYPNQGDYDFNDVVVKYRIEEIDGEEEAYAYLDFAASGASFPNNFGINGRWLITDGSCTGFRNVYESQPYVPSTEVMYRVPIQKGTEGVSEYIPMLNNQRKNGIFDLNTYNPHTSLFPNVFEIPTHSYRWCLETLRIDAAYRKYDAWVKSGCSDELAGWYLDDIDESLVYNKAK
jgi:hypothetical protein